MPFSDKLCIVYTGHYHISCFHVIGVLHDSTIVLYHIPGPDRHCVFATTNLDPSNLTLPAFVVSSPLSSYFERVAGQLEALFRSIPVTKLCFSTWSAIVQPLSTWPCVLRCFRLELVTVFFASVVLLAIPSRVSGTEQKPGTKEMFRDEPPCGLRSSVDTLGFACAFAPRHPLVGKPKTCSVSGHLTPGHRLIQATVAPPPPSVGAPVPNGSETRSYSTPSHHGLNFLANGDMERDLQSFRLATRGDLGPLKDVEIESTGLGIAIAGGAIVASIIVLIIVV